MNIDTELDAWREQWQSGVTVAPDLKAIVERQSRWMKIALAADILVTVVIGGGTAAWAVFAPEPDIRLLAIVTWLFIAAAWAFAWKTNRGNWAPAALSTAAFIDLSIRRCCGRLAATTFGAWLFLTEMVFCLAWIRNHAGKPRQSLLNWLFLDWDRMGFVWLATLAFFAFLFWYRRKKRAELKYLLDLRDGQQP